MTALTAAVVLVGALGVLNLLLTFGVVRRLRADTGMTAQPRFEAPMASVGTSVRGGGVDWSGEALVGFFAPGCAPCEEQVPEFVEHAPRWERAVAVVFDPAGEGAEHVRELGRVARVVIESDTGDALQKAFQVKGFPGFCVVRDGVVVSVGGRIADLTEQVMRTAA